MSALLPVVLVLVVIGTMVIVKVTGGSTARAQAASRLGAGSRASAGEPGTTALAPGVGAALNVPAAALDNVGSPSSVVAPSRTGSSSILRAADGKPVVTYIGAEYCPYCAAQRWAMIVALSRFGTFSGLTTVHSASRDVYPNTPTFTFHGSHYTSKYVSFAPVEETTNVPNGASSYTPLDKPTAAQQALASKYDSQGSIPFIDFGNKYVEVGNLAGYGPQDLSGKSWNQIAAALSDPSSPIAKAVDGSANYTTAAICKLTNNQPASACTPAVKALEAKL
jgi:hypothetical protein